MLDSFLNMLLAFLKILKWPLLIIVGLYAVFMMIYFFYLILAYAKGIRPAKTSVKHLKRPNILYSLFILAPRQMVSDYMSRPADFFNPQGIIIFTG
ncbi:MAG: hypothetical protein LUE92_10780 [Clostridiales bacterium]|nr:hypothetical protein [Clostridiales bacterium]